MDEVNFTYLINILQLFVANLPLKTGTIHQTEYDAKKVDICKFTLNKKKPIFD